MANDSGRDHKSTIINKGFTVAVRPDNAPPPPKAENTQKPSAPQPKNDKR